MSEQPSIATKKDAIQQAKLSAETLWQAARLSDLADGLDLHPLITGLVFELPWAGSGKPIWSKSDRQRWVNLMYHVLDMCFERVDEEVADEFIAELAEKEHEIAELEKLVEDLRGDFARNFEELPELRNRVIELEVERDRLLDAAKVVPIRQSPVGVLDQRVAAIELAREQKDAKTILGYDLDANSAKRNREARGWSWDDLSARSGVHVNAIERLEAGTYQVLDWQLARVAAAFVLSEDAEEAQA